MEDWAPYRDILQTITIIVALAAFWLSYRTNKKTEQLPYLKLLHDELNDIIISLYDLFGNPTWEPYSEEQKDLIREHHDRNFQNFLKGNKFFVISSIPINESSIKQKIENSSRRIIYFNMLKERYIMIYDALKASSEKYGKAQPFYNYFELVDYKRIYNGFKSLPNISKKS